jgi:replication factor C small subunit
MSNLLWVEKFRPNSIEDCVLPVEIKNVFQNIVDTGEVPNLLLLGHRASEKLQLLKHCVTSLVVIG